MVSLLFSFITPFLLVFNKGLLLLNTSNYKLRFISNIYLGWKFQQDNAKIHKANACIAWFKRNKISLFQYPAYSPDLAPIENVWSLLKNRLLKRLETTIGVGLSNASINAFKRAILEE